MVLILNDGRIRGMVMSGTVIVGVGIVMIVLSVVLSITSIVYRKTSGKRIKQELQNEYE